MFDGEYLFGAEMFGDEKGAKDISCTGAGVVDNSCSPNISEAPSSAGLVHPVNVTYHVVENISTRERREIQHR
jgi:hypothetical protein